MSQEDIARDIADPSRFAGLAALLDHAAPPWVEGTVPPLGHWLCFQPQALQSEIGEDGHPRREDGTLPRRMWAGSRIRFLKPVPLGAAIERRTRTAAVNEKTGRSGRMKFVTLEHRIHLDGGDAVIVEEQDVVYREAADPGAPLVRPPGDPAEPGAATRTIVADPVMLFRYSALTFNGHRIHYDRDYATGAEGYPGLVVHGPLIATLLMDHLLRSRPALPVAYFEFRAQSPLFDGEPIALSLTTVDGEARLRAIGPFGTALQAIAR